jgi:hypothetical protein
MFGSLIPLLQQWELPYLCQEPFVKPQDGSAAILTDGIKSSPRHRRAGLRPTIIEMADKILFMSQMPLSPSGIQGYRIIIPAFFEGSIKSSSNRRRKK